jgi:hypothetical protein
MDRISPEIIDQHSLKNKDSRGSALHTQKKTMHSTARRLPHTTGIVSCKNCAENLLSLQASICTSWLGTKPAVCASCASLICQTCSTNEIHRQALASVDALGPGHALAVGLLWTNRKINRNKEEPDESRCLPRGLMHPVAKTTWPGDAHGQDTSTDGSQKSSWKHNKNLTKNS